MKKNILFILLICIVAINYAQEQDLNIADMVQPVPESYILQDPSYFIWGGSVIEGKDGKYHMLYARWSKSLGFSAWVTDSEIAHAVADKLEGPYVTTGTVLERRGNSFWDGMTTHNPTVIEKDGKYYLYYMGTTGPVDIKRPISSQHKDWWTYRNNQRIGVAVADNPQGPWKRFDKPVLNVANTPGAYDELMTSNPSVTYNDEGKVIMTYKAVDRSEAKPNGIRVRFMVAFSNSPVGPFVKEKKPIFEAPNSNNSHMVAEDPYIWYHNGMYRAVVRDVIGTFTGDGGALALLESKDGKDWKPAKYPKVLSSKFKWADGKLSGAKLERPQLFIKNGVPKFLFGGTSLGVDGARTSSGNVRFKLLENSYFKNEDVCFKLKKEGFRFGFSNAEGKAYVSEHPSAGLELNGSKIIEVTENKKYINNEITKVFNVKNTEGEEAEIRLSLENNLAKFEITPKNDLINDISLKLAGMPVAHGLGDAAAYKESFNITKNKEDNYLIKNDGGGRRWASSFAIFPKNDFAGVFFDKGKKQVTISENEYNMTVKKAGKATFYYFFGSPETIYKNYKSIRNIEGYEDVKPKFRLFELGWESWDALGWNTSQTTVKGILEKFHENNYPIRWAVTGSGFWDEGGTTTSFGRWGEKFSEAMSFKAWMHGNDIKWMIGLRTNMIPEGGPYYPKTKKRDKNLKVKSFYGNKLTTKAKKRGYLVTDDQGKVFSITSGVFPIVPSNLIDGTVKGAAQWYQKQYAKWNIDGIKEDTMMRLDSLTGIYNAPITEISKQGGLVMARNGEFTAPGTLLRINDTGVGELSRRIPINYMQYAASGFPNVYSDVAGVHNMHNLKNVDKNIRHTWLLSLTSGLAVGAYPQKWTKDKQEIFKKAINFHYKLAPYMYSAAVDGYKSGYPSTLTPLTIAYPNDENVADLNNFQWMIGESVLATPLLKNHTSGKKDVYLPEGTWYDYETGQQYQGPATLNNYELPLDKVPCFIGGKGVVVLRESDDKPLVAKVYPIAEEETDVVFTYPDGETKSTITYTKWKCVKDIEVIDLTTNESITFTEDEKSGSLCFSIEENHNYKIKEK